MLNYGFVAFCPALDLSGYGYTIEESKKSFEKNLEIFFEETIEKGTIYNVLLNLGWSLKKKPKYDFIPPDISSSLINEYSHSPGFTLKDEVVQVPLKL